MYSKKDKVKKEKIHLNKKELKNISKLLNKSPDNTRFKIKSIATGIGSKITVKIESLDDEFDVTDYDSW